MNNKMIKSLLVAALTLSAAHLSADAGHTNKTFLMPRAQGVNLPMHATTFYDLVNRKAQDKFGANFQVTGFWQQSAAGSEQGKYFLADNKSTIDVSRAAAAATHSTATGTVDLGLLLHEYNLGGADTANSNTLSLDPQQEVYGVRLDYHQDLHKLVKGLYLSANLPVVNVSNDPRLTVKANAAGLATADNIRKLFAGTYTAAAAANKQDALTKGKISGSHSETGVADIDVTLGYKFLDKAKYHAAVGLAVTIPTGTEATGDWLFEPMVGNGQHWALGGDFCAGARVWEGEEQALSLNLALKYRYLFESNERRVLGLKGTTQVHNSKLAQYQLLGKAGATSAVPAANVLAMNCDVTPGSQLDANLGMSYHRGGFSVEMGYNMYFREDESVKRKDSLTAATYGVLARNKDISAGFAVGTAGDFDGNGAAVLSNDNIDTSAAETPSQFTNAIYGGAGYVFKNWDCPLMLGLGAKYEWANKNSALEQWGAWLKVGVGF
jgi:hypothetical protein